MGQALQTLVFRPPTPATYGPNGDLIWIPTEHNSVIPAIYVKRYFWGFFPLYSSMLSNIPCMHTLSVIFGVLSRSAHSSLSGRLSECH